MSFSAKPAQRDRVRSLMRDLELDPRNITLMHKPALKRAGLWADAYQGTSVDALIDRLSYGQASALIDALVAQVGDA